MAGVETKKLRVGGRRRVQLSKCRIVGNKCNFSFLVCYSSGQLICEVGGILASCFGFRLSNSGAAYKTAALNPDLTAYSLGRSIHTN